MYDSVNFWIDRAMVGGEPFTIAQYLTDQAEHKSERGYSISGRAGDYSIYLNDSGISMRGSLPKFLLPDNIHTLSRAGARDAIDKLSDEIHLPIKLAKVTRVDVSTVLPMKREPAEYYHYLGNKPHFKRLQATKTTLYYNTDKRQLIFYDKRAEAKSKGVTIPAGFVGANLLRVEVRFTERLQKQFNITEVTGATLTDERFYIDMVKRWGKEYFLIDKLKSVSIMDTSNIKTPKEGATALFSIMLQEKGQEYINSFIADLRAKNTYPDPKYYSRLKEELNSLIVASTVTDQNELIKELDKAVNEIVLNCR
ncbi:MAG: hypothetical protein M0R39_08760 [Prolixibacteraceae bacterium]|nr:hypothetical protein [Prolixibacteraceae bacterium]